MKNFFVFLTLFVLVLACDETSNPQKEYIGPEWKGFVFGNNYNFLAVKFFDRNFGLIIEQHGYVKITENGGHTWNSTMLPDHDYAYLHEYAQILFLDKLNIWVTTVFGLYKSNDGGKTWTKLEGSGEMSYNNPCDLTFIDNNTAWLINKNQVCRTTNGGTTWFYPENAPNYSTRLCFIDKRNGYILCNKYKYNDSREYIIYRTTDDGESWNSVYEFSCQSEYYIHPNIHFLTPETGFLITDEMLKTTDSGSTWRKLETDNINMGKGIKSYSILDENHIWYLVSINTDAGYFDLYPAFKYTHNGGKSWRTDSYYIRNYYDYYKQLNDIFFLDENYGWAVGNDGLLLETTNGGI